MRRSNNLASPSLKQELGHETFDPRIRERAIGQRLAAFRRRAHLTQADVGNALGYSQSRVAKVEIGERRLTLTDAIDLARLYGVSVLDLLPAADWGPRPQRRRDPTTADPG
jgi:transcriptional regulator with XRE-family HTH domain